MFSGARPDLEWKLTYVGSAESESFDQELDTCMVGPVPVGVNSFEFEVSYSSPAETRRDADRHCCHSGCCSIPESYTCKRSHWRHCNPPYMLLCRTRICENRILRQHRVRRHCPQGLVRRVARGRRTREGYNCT